MTRGIIENQARMLAKDNRSSGPDIQRIFWFPDDQEVRLIEVSELIPASGDKRIQPFYFRASPTDDLPAPTAVTIIRPDEVRKIELPVGWGDWEGAVEIQDDSQ